MSNVTCTMLSQPNLHQQQYTPFFLVRDIPSYPSLSLPAFNSQTYTKQHYHFHNISLLHSRHTHTHSLSLSLTSVLTLILLHVNSLFVSLAYNNIGTPLNIFLFNVQLNYSCFAWILSLSNTLSSSHVPTNALYFVCLVSLPLKHSFMYLRMHSISFEWILSLSFSQTLFLTFMYLRMLSISFEWILSLTYSQSLTQSQFYLAFVLRTKLVGFLMFHHTMSPAI